ncbi:MAG: FG-GAP-like repeat-containing protein [Flavobacteriales bacterium]
MKKSLLLVAMSLGVCTAHAQNTCATAVPVIAGTYTVVAVDGAEIPPIICAGAAGNVTAAEWYTYTPAADHSLTITTDLAVNVNHDTRFQVYTGACGALVCESGDDDSGSGYLSIATFNVSQGVTYHIAFDNYWESDGFQFQLLEDEPIEVLVGFHAHPITINGYADCVVDMNGDHLDDVVAPGITNININYQQAGGTFNAVNITTTPADHDASWSIAAGDIDHNGFNDLMYGSGDGVTFMMANITGTAFTEVSFPQYVFCQRTNMVDINSDGHLDAFSCHDVDANVYYLNDGTGNLTFHQGGLGENCGNYGSIWIDLDNDHLMDLFVAKCGCDPVDICYHNNGDGTFTNIATSLGFGDGQQSWSSAWGDYDNDGDMDVLVGTSSGDFQKLMRNNDGTSFTNVTLGSGFDAFLGNSIEWTTHDFNNDGYLDVLGGGALMLNNGDMTFTHAVVPPYNGPIGDLNNDGFLDILNGGTIWMNDGNENHYVKVNTIGTASNSNGIGARVEVVSALGTQIRDVKAGDGFEYMSSLTTHFGLGADTGIEQITVYWPSGLVNVVHTAEVNSTVNIIEGIFEGIDDQVFAPGLAVFPNPATDVLNISADVQLGNAPIVVFDATGKRVMETALSNGRVDVASLTSGVYLLQVKTSDRILQQRFTKQ